MKWDKITKAIFATAYIMGTVVAIMYLVLAILAVVARICGKV